MYLSFGFENNLFKVKLGRADKTPILDSNGTEIVNTMAMNDNQDSKAVACLINKEQTFFHLAYRTADEIAMKDEARSKGLYPTDNNIQFGEYTCRLFKKNKTVTF